jgi:hypothetical protein
VSRPAIKSGPKSFKLGQDRIRLIIAAVFQVHPSIKVRDPVVEAL